MKTITKFIITALAAALPIVSSAQAGDSVGQTAFYNIHTIRVGNSQNAVVVYSNKSTGSTPTTIALSVSKQATGRDGSALLSKTLQNGHGQSQTVFVAPGGIN